MTTNSMGVACHRGPRTKTHRSPAPFSAHAAVGRNDPDKAGNTANVESRARRSTPQEAVSCFIVGAFQGELCCMIGGQLDPSQSALCWSIYCDLVGKSLRRAKADPMSKS